MALHTQHRSHPARPRGARSLRTPGVGNQQGGIQEPGSADEQSSSGKIVRMTSPEKLDRIVADARHAAAAREQGYREQALKIYPWICGRCAREFTRTNLRELTVHHRDHDHSHNPPDGSNWELLCLYCHDNEHQRQLEMAGGSVTGGTRKTAAATHSPFSGLKTMLGRNS